VSRFQVGAAGKPARAVAAPTQRTVAVLKTVGRGGAALAPTSAPDADGWESF
jgi:methyl-accepting chemotaxis protein